MLYVYAVTDLISGPLPKTTGMDELPIEDLTESGLCVVVSRYAQRKFSPTPGEVLRHERVVESLMQVRTVLPVRFGTTLAGEDELRRAIAGRAATLLEGLDRVRGCVELGLRVVGKSDDRPLPAPEATEANSGRSWMLKRLAREQETQRTMDADERLATSLHNPLAKLSRNASFRLRTGGSFVMSAAYLVPRDGIDRFTDEIQCLADDRPQLHLLCTGPWPPYSFTPQFKTGEDADA